MPQRHQVAESPPWHHSHGGSTTPIKEVSTGEQTETRSAMQVDSHIQESVSTSTDLLQSGTYPARTQCQQWQFVNGLHSAPVAHKETVKVE